jgi:EAL domain-containing protein (putative c-di-GMP-specific phosphodiesterase class I)/GGDEF domain-containing protein
VISELPARAATDAADSLPPLHAVFQPIVRSSSAAIEGYEALIRGPVGSPLHEPAELFAHARACGQLARLELLALETAARTFGELELPGRLFLNASPALVTRHTEPFMAFVRKLADCRLAPERVVIELTEGDKIHDHERMREVIGALRAQGLQIALDDLGEGFSSLRLWKELAPEIVKVDKHFIQGIDRDPLKRQFLRAIQDIGLAAQTQLVAEGVETAGEFRVIRDLKVTFAQGHFIARPSPAPERETGHRVAGLTQPARLYPELVSDWGVTAFHLATRIEPVSPRQTGHQVYERFARDGTTHALPVVDNGVPVGLISRFSLIDRFARPYRREVYGNKSCVALMNPTPLVVEHTTGIQEIGWRLADGGAGHDLAEGFIVTQDGLYVGISSGQALLRELSELQVKTARYANPLTLLPGNVPITQHIERLLDSELPFCVCHTDLDHFKPFNDLYGYRRGDDMIQLVAKALEAAIDPACDLVGHVGGDDFIVIFQSDDWDARIAAALQDFEHERLGLFGADDLERQGFASVDRSGRPQFFPLTTLSVGAVQVPGGVRTSAHQVAARAGEAKTQAKKMAGNALFVDRRAWGPGLAAPALPAAAPVDERETC